MQTSEETLALASGSCRDSAWLLVEVCAQPGSGRALRVGISDSAEAGREAAGGPGRPRRGFHRPARVGRGLPARRGWVGLDPTSGLFAGEGHIPLAATPSAESAAPVSGLVSRESRWSSCTRCRSRGFTKTRASPGRTPTRSGTTSWRSATGLDEELVAGDVRLTMGGEPTFVSIDDMDGEEWNTAAMGPNKQPARRRPSSAGCAKPWRRAACCTSVRASGIPGESLPRWAFTCYWRDRRRAAVDGIRRSLGRSCTVPARWGTRRPSGSPKPWPSGSLLARSS